MSRKYRRTNYALQGVNLAISTTINTSYPPNVKIERLRALHVVLENFKSSIRSLDDWDELKRLESRIYEETAKYKEQLPPGVITHF